MHCSDVMKVMFVIRLINQCAFMSVLILDKRCEKNMKDLSLNGREWREERGKGEREKRKERGSSERGNDN